MKRSHADLSLPDDLQATEVGASRGAAVRRDCPYLDTIQRDKLDFDFEKLCSVSLSNLNVYVCLVCGKYFQGRGPNTHAYTHSVQEGHHVFLNVQSKKTYCLPDNYEVEHPSLSDIVQALHPTFTEAEIHSLDTNTALATDVHGVSYLPGFVGVNTLSHCDYVNVVLHGLAHVPQLRDFLLRPANFAHLSERKHPLMYRVSELFRKLWSPRNFKSVVSPHEALQAVSTASGKRFHIGERKEVSAHAALEDPA